MGRARRTVLTGRVPGAAAALLLAAALSACASGSGEAERTGGTPAPTATASVPVPAATASPEGETTLPDAVRTILVDIAALRELDPPPALHALTISRRDLPALIERLTTDEELRRFDELTTLYRLLGHLRRDQDLWSVRQTFLDLVLGLYAPTEKTLWVVTEREGVGLDELAPRQMQTLAHEIMHALQDYHFDLETGQDLLPPHDLDRTLAWTAAVEGDAVVHTSRYAERVHAWPAGGSLFFLAVAPQPGVLPPSIARELYFPYTTGADWAREILSREGLEALNAFIADPPAATAIILHPELLASGWAPEAVALPPLTMALEDGWRLESDGVLGEFHIDNYLWAGEVFPRVATAAAAGWAGDRYSVYVRGDASVLVARVRFVDAQEAREFAEAHREFALGGAAVVEAGSLTLATQANGNVIALAEPLGRDAIFAIGTDSQAARAALEALLAG